jgi:hypothetical protein
MTQPTPTPPTPPAPAPSPPPNPAAPAPASPPTDPPPTTPPTPNPDGDKPLGPGGERALAAEREANRKLREKLGPLADMDVGPLVQLAQALGGKPTGDTKTDLELLTERMSQLEQSGQADRAARFRAEVAHEKGLSASQAARLQGSTREELAADADALLALFPAAGPRNPAPDPSQGNRGGGNAAADLDARIAEAQSKRDFRTVIALQKQKLANVPR